MKRIPFYLIGLSLLSLVACNNSSEEAEDKTAKSTGEEYKLNLENSQIRWFGEKIKNNEVVGSHNGTVKFIKGNLLFENKNIIGGAFEIDMNSISEESVVSKDATLKLVNDLKSENFFETAKYPIAKVTITGGNQETIKGVLKVRDMEMDFEAPISVQYLENKIQSGIVFDLDFSPLRIASLGGDGEFISPKIGLRIFMELVK